MRLTRHARTALVEREIEEGWVEKVLRNPEWIESDPGRPGVRRGFGRIAERGDRILRVVYTAKPGEELVISVFFDRDAKRKRTSPA